MKSTRIAIALAAMISLAACATNGGEKQTLGTLIGAGLGGLAGSQIGSGTGQLAAVGVGVLLGGLLGWLLSRLLDGRGCLPRSRGGAGGQRDPHQQEDGRKDEPRPPQASITQGPSPGA